MSACRRVATLSAAAACLLLAPSCGQPSRNDLHKAAESLLPQGAAVLLKKEGGCVEGAGFPSCVEVFFRLEQSGFAERLRLFIINAREHGWKAERGATAGGEMVVKLSKGSYSGVAGLWLDRYYRPRPHCNPVSTIHPCADHFQIQWKGGAVRA